ncbi:MAG: hypothetical protein MZW92_13150 [Comamonadaceae bacterium]|nr:hypothetical protein [Comamonadaceae bacterium]
MDPSKGGTSGIHFTKVLEEMGIAAVVKPKAVLVDTGFAAERVAKGEAEIVVHQISEILPGQGRHPDRPATAADPEGHRVHGGRHDKERRPGRRQGVHRDISRPPPHGPSSPRSGSIYRE